MPAEPARIGGSTEGSGQEGEPPRPSGTGCELVFQNPNRYPDVGVRTLRPWLEPLLSELVPSAESLTIRLVSDREMHRLNATFRGRDKTTDVLSFPGELEALADGEMLDPGHLGDVVLSMPTTRRQAERHGHGVERELKILILHGILHCMGYDHPTDDGTMEHLAARLRARWIDHG